MDSCKQSSIDLPSIILGGASFSLQYNSDDLLDSNVPKNTILAAFRADINAIDTSPYYTRSEEIIGKVLSDAKFAREFPRS